MSPAHKPSSYGGNTEEEKIENRRWFHEDYQSVWPGKAEMEDLTGKKMTLDQSLRLWGRSIKTRLDCESFFDNDKREAELQQINKTWRIMGKMIHPDNFNKKVMDEEMRKFNNEKFLALNMAKEALDEWDQEARKPSHKQKDKAQFGNLHAWEGEIYVYRSGEYMDYDKYQKENQTKRRKTTK